MTIGYFNRAQVGADGSVGVMSGDLRIPFGFPEKVVLLPVSADRIMRYPNSPKFEIFIANSNLNIGACFEKFSKAGVKYYSVVLESPIFEGGKAFASMFEAHNENLPNRAFEVVWNAPRKEQNAAQPQTTAPQVAQPQTTVASEQYDEHIPF